MLLPSTAASLSSPAMCLSGEIYPVGPRFARHGTPPTGAGTAPMCGPPSTVS
ncbi:hypothetical protein BN2537_4307 [Streptomyces venezuelae]|nr:hypothetical protein BN2537_4307 [Streptomyces venezuelae]